MTQKRYITKVKNLAEKFPEEVSYLTNKDGSILAHIPIKVIKFSLTKSIPELNARKGEALARYKTSKQSTV